MRRDRFAPGQLVRGVRSNAIYQINGYNEGLDRYEATIIRRGDLYDSVGDEKFSLIPDRLEHYEGDEDELEELA